MQRVLSMIAAVVQQCEAKKQVKGHDWLRHIQLKFTGLAGHGNRHVGKDDLEADLINDFGITRFTLPGMTEEPGCIAGMHCGSFSSRRSST